jgi:hypothetical protein
MKGIVFMGTPHLGAADAVKWAKYLLTLGNIVTMGSIRDDHHERLLPKGEELLEISRQAVEPLSKLAVLSMYERKTMKNILVKICSHTTRLGQADVCILAQLVDETSATLGIPNERLFPIERNHVEICKYSEDEEEALKTILRPIIGLAKAMSKNQCM